MCGLFGFIGKHPNRDKILELAILAERRGYHAHGIVTPSYQYKQFGCPSNSTNSFINAITPDFNLLIGHCRLATSGSAADSKNNQPIVTGDIAIAHNGNVRNAAYLVESMNLTPETECDSEVISLLMHSAPGALQQRLTKTLKIIDRSPVALLAATLSGSNSKSKSKSAHQYELIALSDGLPLYQWQAANGDSYFCSVKFDGAITISGILSQKISC